MSEFTQIPVLRGFEAIKPIYEVAQKEGGFIAGGYVRYMCSPHENPAPAGDVDMFPSNDDALCRLLAALCYRLDYQTKRESNVAYTLEKPNALPVQLMKTFERGVVKTFGTLEEIIGNFDFTVVRLGLLSETTALADCEFPMDEFHKTLQLRVISSPVAALLRANKYAGKGYFLGPGEAVKLFSDWDGRTAEWREKMIEFLQRGDAEWSQEDIEEGEEMFLWGEDDDD